MTAFVTRFAPSPTGYLHPGHAFSALTAWRAARAAGGRFLLRIEDIDAARCRPEFETAIYEDLAWLGVNWAQPVRRQSEHFDDYAAALDRLIGMGVVYRCFRTRKEIIDEIARAPHLSVDGPAFAGHSLGHPMADIVGFGRRRPEDPQFVGAPLPADEEAARIAAGEPYAWRLSIGACRARLGPALGALDFVEEGSGPKGERGRIKARPEIFGDVIIARKDAGTSYHLASVHDDALAGVTHVIRGEDLFHAAHLHRLLQVLLGLPAPVYRHHRLIADETGKRFAKRDKSATIRAQREAGKTREDVLAQLGLHNPARSRRRKPKSSSIK
jgi:glutamyl-Q tRNA(Asp) synthetase